MTCVHTGTVRPSTSSSGRGMVRESPLPLFVHATPPFGSALQTHVLPTAHSTATTKVHVHSLADSVVCSPVRGMSVSSCSICKGLALTPTLTEHLKVSRSTPILIIQMVTIIQFAMVIIIVDGSV